MCHVNLEEYSCGCACGKTVQICPERFTAVALEGRALEACKPLKVVVSTNVLRCQDDKQDAAGERVRSCHGRWESTMNTLWEAAWRVSIRYAFEKKGTLSYLESSKRERDTDRAAKMAWLKGGIAMGASTEFYGAFEEYQRNFIKEILENIPLAQELGDGTTVEGKGDNAEASRL
ncbi:hypothetical protein B0T25DRAFT_533077 [Lasiosphaeria hispida]|uniref:Uncharacterized protein n=1 Tax=Lasiosphaeria hispida TaxID=260671 RepID=A0AAJ0HQ88_9PEZI|nr:hypothetical protein B0T25DRAFT_533077 [Lasiosphaeria hispida]